MRLHARFGSTPEYIRVVVFRISNEDQTQTEINHAFAIVNDEIVENRKEPKNTVKQKAQKSTKELNNIKSKADALALDREMSEKEINKPVTRSDSEFRRPLFL